jgi:hypothetical protein
MNRFTLSRRHAKRRQPTVRPEPEFLETRSLLSGTPPLNVNTDSAWDGGLGTAPHTETSIAVNPTNPRNMIGGVIDYQFDTQNATRGKVFLSAFNRAHVTLDGGRTWMEYPVPDQGYNFTSDPSVSFDADGRAYLDKLAFTVSENLMHTNSNAPDLVVNHSTDGGLTWSPAVRVAKGTGSASQATWNDKPYLTAWGHGDAIVTWTQYHFGPAGHSFDRAPFGAVDNYIDAPIYASVTHDGGNTWTDPVRISGSSYVSGIDAVPTVAADGSIDVAFWSWDHEDAPDLRDHYVVVKVDPATGQPKGDPVQVGLVYDGLSDYPIGSGVNAPVSTLQDTQFYVSPNGNITADPTNAQHVAVIWSDMRNNPYPGARLPSLDPYAVQTNSDIIVSQSFNGGVDWSPPTAIQIPSDQFQPWGAYNSSGLLQIGYYDRSYDLANHQYGYTLASETNPGSLNFTFQQVTTVLSDPTKDDAWVWTRTANPDFPNPTPFIGDYSGIAVVPGTNQVAALWTDMREQAPSGGHAEDAYFALVDPSAARSAASASALTSAATAVARPAPPLSSAAPRQALAVDADFLDRARMGPTTSSVANGSNANLARGVITLDIVALTDNQATGGAALGGGDGLIGGLYRLGTATLIKSTVTRNKVKWGAADAGTLAGSALGGGVYNAGGISIDALTVISGNAPDNRYGC